MHSKNHLTVSTTIPVENSVTYTQVELSPPQFTFNSHIKGSIICAPNLSYLC